MKRQFLAVLVGVFTLAATATAIAAPSQPASVAQADQVSEVDWSECKRPDRQGFDCARYRVPRDYDRPNGRTIGLKLVKLPATDQANKLGTIFLNPGGPGGSGVDFVLGAGQFLFTEEVRAVYDLVGFDPRGIARSRPVRCFDTFDEALLSFPPFAFPVGPEQEAAEMAAVEYLANACATNANGGIINHMSTANVARDLDRLREAVGDDHLNYAGYSYGSYLGQVYANLFPDKVGHLYIDAILDPIAWLNEGGDTPFSEALRSDVGAQDTLDEFFRLCDAAGPSNCALAPYSSDRFDYMADVLWEEGYVLITDPDGNQFPFLYSDLIGSSLGPLYDSFGWPFHAEFLAYIEGQIRPPTLSLTAEQLGHVQIGFDALAEERLARERYPNVVEGFPGVACSDTNNPDEYSAWPESGAAADAAYGYFGRLWTHASVPCWLWPGADGDRYEGPFTADTANTVLIGSTLYDPATRYQGAVTAHDLLPNSALMTVQGWGHSTIFLSFCADQIVADYFLTGATPQPGTVCQQDFTPFLVPFDGNLGAELVTRQALRAEALEEISYAPGR
ncbi:MAG: alpha/beta fold hydrolase [Acidimicrobiia bacterium]|nr:alpha/beta fold hydrolase [Acidimicrobiia bacterium]